MAKLLFRSSKKKKLEVLRNKIHGAKTKKLSVQCRDSAESFELKKKVKHDSTEKVAEKLQHENTGSSNEAESRIINDSITQNSETPNLNVIEDQPEVTFRSLGVCEELCLACDKLKWSFATPIQTKCIPHALNKKDVVGLAETGSGKTAAFAIPIIHCLLDEANHRGIYALVLSPTRELSAQITETFYALGSSIDIKVCTILGGLDSMTQAVELAKKPHVVVATPGRIVDHLENTKGFHLSTIKFLVLDEADRLLSMDFEDALNKLLSLIPKNRTTMLFSATMTDRVSKLQKASLKNPVKIQVNMKYDTVKNLVQYMKLIAPQFKYTYLVAVLAYYKNYKSIVFVNTCIDTQKVASCLHQLAHQSVCLHGKMSQPQRLGALNSFKSGMKNILVATEVGSRGLDIPHVDLVINFDVPLGSKDYVHRVGRTARAGRYDVQLFQQIELLTKNVWNPLQTYLMNIGGLFTRKLVEHEMKEQKDIKPKQFRNKRRSRR